MTGSAALATVLTHPLPMLSTSSTAALPALRAVGFSLTWCGDAGMPSIAAVQTLHVAA